MALKNPKNFLPVPYHSYKVKSEDMGSGTGSLYFVPGLIDDLRVEGITEEICERSNGMKVRKKSFVLVNEKGRPIAATIPENDSGPDEKHFSLFLKKKSDMAEKTFSILVSQGEYLRSSDKQRCIKYSTRKYDRKNGTYEM